MRPLGRLDGAGPHRARDARRLVLERDGAGVVPPVRAVVAGLGEVEHLRPGRGARRARRDFERARRVVRRGEAERPGGAQDRADLRRVALARPEQRGDAAPPRRVAADHAGAGRDREVDAVAAPQHGDAARVGEVVVARVEGQERLLREVHADVAAHAPRRRGPPHAVGAAVRDGVAELGLHGDDVADRAAPQQLAGLGRRGEAARPDALHEEGAAGGGGGVERRDVVHRRRERLLAERRHAARDEPLAERAVRVGPRRDVARVGAVPVAAEHGLVAAVRRRAAGVPRAELARRRLAARRHGHDLVALELAHGVREVRGDLAGARDGPAEGHHSRAAVLQGLSCAKRGCSPVKIEGPPSGEIHPSFAKRMKGGSKKRKHGADAHRYSQAALVLHLARPDRAGPLRNASGKARLPCSKAGRGLVEANFEQPVRTVFWLQDHLC